MGGVRDGLAQAYCNRRRAASAAVSLPVLADDQKPANSQGQNPPNAQGFVPRLNDIMVATQLEGISSCGTLVQCRTWRWQNTNADRSAPVSKNDKSLYPNNPSSNMTMMTPARQMTLTMQSRRRTAPNSFQKLFKGKLTAACNSCHEATGFSFIKIRRSEIIAP